MRRSLIDGVTEKGDVLIASLKLVPETRNSLTFNHWKDIVSEELANVTALHGNGEPLLSDAELNTLAAITFPCRGW